MIKLDRNYLLTVEGRDGSTVAVTPPFTLEIDITRNTLSSLSVGQFKIFNLSKDKRNNLRFNVSDIGRYQEVKLLAGYGTNLKLIFTGNISQAWSVREGVNFVTTIECYDGGYAFNNSETATTFTAEQTKLAYYRSIIGDLDHVEQGAIGPSAYTDTTTGVPITLGLGQAVTGKSATLIRDEASGGSKSGFFVDLGLAHILGDNEYIAAATPVIINAQTGLLSTPVLEETIVRFDMLFEPTLNPGYLAILTSSTDANYTGAYKITGVKHHGVISGAVSGELITSGEFFYSAVLTPVPLPIGGLG